MELLLVGAGLSLMGLLVTWIALKPAREETLPRPASAPVPPARFFGDRVHRAMPLELLLLQIENHVRLEHAAAESFVAAPNSVLLHSRTVSPLLERQAC
jgi:hypothetical protein